MPKVKCPIDGCPYTAEDESKDMVLELIKAHSIQHQPGFVPPAGVGDKINTALTQLKV